eukprot:scaffold139535_cov36-Tisochrysis_lutea.AAC.2
MFTHEIIECCLFKDLHADCPGALVSRRAGPVTCVDLVPRTRCPIQALRKWLWGCTSTNVFWLGFEL